MYDDDNVWSIDSTFHNPYNFSSVAPTLSPIECSNEHSKIIETSPFSISFLVQSLASQISSFKISQIIVPTFTRRSTFRYRSNFPTNIVHKTAKQLLPLNQFQKQAISSNPSANTSITFSIIKRSNLIRNVLSDKSWNNVLPKKKKKKNHEDRLVSLNWPYLATATKRGITKTLNRETIKLAVEGAYVFPRTASLQDWPFKERVRTTT